VQELNVKTPSKEEKQRKSAKVNSSWRAQASNSIPISNRPVKLEKVFLLSRTRFSAENRASFSNPVDLEMVESHSPCKEGASGRRFIIKKERKKKVTIEGEREDSEDAPRTKKSSECSWCSN